MAENLKLTEQAIELALLRERYVALESGLDSSGRRNPPKSFLRVAATLKDAEST